MHRTAGIFSRLTPKEWDEFLEAQAAENPEDFYHGFNNDEEEAWGFWKNYYQKLPAGTQERIWREYQKHPGRR